MKIITNNVPRDIINARELSEKERKEFDYLNWDVIDTGWGDDVFFFRYKGELYDLGEFERCYIDGWDGQQTDSFFSATLVRYVDNFERIIVGRLYT
jgi:hypothetical protein